MPGVSTVVGSVHSGQLGPVLRRVTTAPHTFGRQMKSQVTLRSYTDTTAFMLTLTLARGRMAGAHVVQPHNFSDLPHGTSA